MPRPPKTVSEFDVCLGRVIKSKRVKAGLTRAGLAEATGIPEANLKRREAGQNEISTGELYRIADVVGVPAARLVEEALEDYGGMDKLLEEYGPKSEPDVTVTAEDNVTYLGHVRPPLDAAADEHPRK